MPDYTRCFPLFLSLHLFRSWRTHLYKGSCALICVSVDHEDSPRMGAVRRVVLESQYLLEPCGTGRTRLTHISRVDLRCGQTSSVLIVEAWTNIAVLMCVIWNSCYRGRSPEWYNKAFGHLCVNEAQMIRSSFHLLDQTSTEAKIWMPGIRFLFLDHTSRAAGPESRWSRRGGAEEKWCLLRLLSHTELYCIILYWVVHIQRRVEVSFCYVFQ